MASRSKRGVVRYAVVGQGYIAQAAVLPAFAHAGRNSRLVALVSGDARKRRELARKYRVPAHAYEEYDSLLESGAVDAVYIALPDDQHLDYTLRAARRGVKLMTAYRLHFERAPTSACATSRAAAAPSTTSASTASTPRATCFAPSPPRSSR